MRIKVGQLIEFDYVNHMEHQSHRRVIVVGFHYGTTEYHPNPQWLLEAFCTDRKAPRHFAMSDMTNVKEAT